ncbi:MAG TPA: branched-chain amino acid ABC transporter permease [Thermodesulfobacteriota bacterium]|nr:branched-chain amino acid ABC transporter permease [Thermodesulfobacteriota bacterium]
MWVIYTLNGLYFAALLFLTSLGLNIILGVMGILNLAHGSFYAIGAFMGAWTIIQIVTKAPAPLLYVSLLSGFLLAGIVGWIMEKTLIRAMYKRTLEYQLLLTFGALLLLEDLIKMVWGGQALYASAPFDRLGKVEIMGSVYPAYFLLVIAITLCVGFLIWLFMGKTRLGIMLRAISLDREMATGLGLDISRLSTLAFVLGSGLAGLAGALVIPTTPALLGIGMEPLIFAFIVVVVGGLGSLKGALVGALLVGLTRSFGIAIFPEIELPLLFLIAGIILVAKPQGLFGR